MKKHTHASSVRFVKSIDIVDGMSFPRFGAKNIECSATKRYHNTLMLLFSLPECSRNLMDYIMDKMTDDNIVNSNQYTRDLFNSNIYSAWFEHFKLDVKKKQSSNFGLDANELALKKKYSDITIRKAFSTLKEKGLILQQTRGVYMVNPEYFFKKSESSRIEKVKMYLEFENGIDIIKISTEGI